MNREARNKQHDTKHIVILGPTASGKSALAMKLAQRFGGYVEHRPLRAMSGAKLRTMFAYI